MTAYYTRHIRPKCASPNIIRGALYNIRLAYLVSPHGRFPFSLNRIVVVLPYLTHISPDRSRRPAAGRPLRQQPAVHHRREASPDPIPVRAAASPTVRAAALLAFAGHRAARPSRSPLWLHRPSSPNRLADAQGTSPRECGGAESQRCWTQRWGEQKRDQHPLLLPVFPDEFKWRRGCTCGGDGVMAKPWHRDSRLIATYARLSSLVADGAVAEPRHRGSFLLAAYVRLGSFNEGRPELLARHRHRAITHGGCRLEMSSAPWKEQVVADFSIAAGKDISRNVQKIIQFSPGYESREVAEEKWRRHRRKKWRNFLVITNLLLFMVGYVLYFI